MSSWWIEGKVAGGFQYLPETYPSQKSMQLLKKANLTLIACYCKLILQWHIAVNIKMKFSLHCGNVDLWTFLQLLPTMQREKKSLFSLLLTRLIKGKTVFILLCLNLLMKWLFKDERELTVYSDGPSREFKNQFITVKLLYLLSQHLNLQVCWKYFATLHGKGVFDSTGGAAKSRVREQVRNKGKGSIVVQSSVDFATVVSKLLPNVKIIHIDEAEI